MEDIGRDWESSSDAASPSPSIGSQASVMGSNGTKKAINRGRWTKDEVSLKLLVFSIRVLINCFKQDEKLRRLVEIHGERWDFIASHFADRADVQCQHRWSKVVNPELVKGEPFQSIIALFKVHIKNYKVFHVKISREINLA